MSDCFALLVKFIKASASGANPDFPMPIFDDAFNVIVAQSFFGGIIGKKLTGRVKSGNPVVPRSKPNGATAILIDATNVIAA